MKSTILVLFILSVSSSLGSLPANISKILEENTPLQNKLELVANQTHNITIIVVNNSKANLLDLQNALYENPKKSNVDERSYVFIDQRYRVPFFSNLQQQIVKEFMEKNNYRYKTFITNVDSGSNVPLEDYPPRYTGSFADQAKPHHMSKTDQAYFSQSHLNFADSDMTASDDLFDYKPNPKSQEVDNSVEFQNTYKPIKPITAIPKEIPIEGTKTISANVRNQYQNPIKIQISNIKEVMRDNMGSNKESPSTDDNGAYVELLKAPLVRKGSLRQNNKVALNDIVKNAKTTDDDRTYGFHRRIFVPETGMEYQDRDRNTLEKLEEESQHQQDGRRLSSSEERSLDRFIKNTLRTVESADDSDIKIPIIKADVHKENTPKHSSNKCSCSAKNFKKPKN